MKKDRKGFTLIELMVVIVIIGILAAIAIPKLFGMSAKAKASEVGPAAGTWSKLQSAFLMEQSRLGDDVEISYVKPGTQTATTATSFTSNFSYATGLAANGSIANWTASNFSFGSDCPAGSGTWSATYNADSGVDADAAGKLECTTLTPNFSKLQ
jgi:prepilin-type N-terminal cleavage/methylation domain-containing protein